MSETSTRSWAPHTARERDEMMARVGVERIEELFEVVPSRHRFPELHLPEPLSEMDLMAELRDIAEANTDLQHTPCFLGAGAYNHFIPSVVGYLVGRSEFTTSYTPYQPEVSQGTLQAIYEYQTMICALTGMEVSNASHYDGATAAAEAVIMADSITRGQRHKVLLSPTLHPEYRETIRTYTQGLDVAIGGDESLTNTLDRLIAMVDDDTVCLVVQNPDFTGRILDLRRAAEAVHAQGAVLAVASNPIALGMLAPPGAIGADIVFGEGQPLGNPLSYGGPYLGYFACRKEHVRRMAGRLVGETVDAHGERGYVLTLATREQHIRREKATSNICTNQGLVALTAAVYMAAMGKRGLAHVARLCYHKAHFAAESIGLLPGYTVDLNRPFFNEFVVDCPAPVEEINEALLTEHNILGGYDLGRVYPGMENNMLLCVTEMNTQADIDDLVDALEEVGS